MTKTLLIRLVVALVALNATIVVLVPQHRIRLVSEVVTVLLIALGVVMSSRRAQSP